jgi:hypothetical protein
LKKVHCHPQKAKGLAGQAWRSWLRPDPHILPRTSYSSDTSIQIRREYYRHAKERFGTTLHISRARTVHFLGMVTLVLFFVVHIAMVLAAGPINEMRSMITGWFRTDRSEPKPAED